MPWILGVLCLLAADEDSFGQTQIRTEWQELQSTTLSYEFYESFMRRHDLVSVSESYLASRLLRTRTLEGLSFSKDPHIAAHQFFTTMSERPLSVHSGLLAGLRWVDSALSRPFDAIPSFLSVIELIVIAGLLSFSVIAFIHLWLWAVPISIDWRIFRQSDVVFRLFLLGLIPITIFLKSWALTGLLFAFLALAYAKGAGFGILGWALVCLFQILQFLGPSLRTAAEKMTALEALHWGRTRIEYSERALNFLNPLEKAAWTLLNGDKSAARLWLEKSEASADKKIFETFLNALDGGPRKGQAEFELLNSSLPGNPVILYNLTQLATSNQNLVAAEKYRNEISTPDYARLNERAKNSGSLLLWGQPRSTRGIIVGEFYHEFINRWGQLLLVAKIGSSLQIFILPLLALILGLGWRRQTPGLCLVTGNATADLQSTESAMALAVKARAKGLMSAQRQNIEIQQRNFASFRGQLTKAWGWCALSIRDIIFNNRPIVSFLFQFVFVLFILSGLSSRLHQWVFSAVGAPARPLVISYDGMPLLFFVAGLIYFWGLMRSYSRGGR